MKKVVISLALTLSFRRVFACLILFITDGKNVLVGNHEDWYATDAEISFAPAHDNKLGILYFDFASEKTAQGGMNTAGLFFDGTRTPYAPYPANINKTDCSCYIWKKILEECRTTEEAISYINKYKVPEIEDVHILFADKSGNAAIIGVYNGELQIHRRTGNYQLLTNFNITNPSYGDEPLCLRFEMANSMLRIDSSATVGNVQKILSKTHQQGLTAYSNIYDLTAGDVYIYQKANFEKKVKLNLIEELRKGKRSVSIAALFHKKL